MHFALQKNTNSMMMHLSSSHFFGHLCANMGTFLRNVNYLPPVSPPTHLQKARKRQRAGVWIYSYIVLCRNLINSIVLYF